MKITLTATGVKESKGFVIGAIVASEAMKVLVLIAIAPETVA